MWQLLLKLCGLVTNISPRCCGYRGNSTNRATADGSPCAGNTNTNRNITVIITTGQLNIPLSIHVNSKVIIVKEEMQRRMHIKINEQLLSFGGKVLEDQKHLHYYCIHDSSFLRLSHLLRGGGEEHQNSGYYNQEHTTYAREVLPCHTGQCDYSTASKATDRWDRCKQTENEDKRDFPPADSDRVGGTNNE